MVDFIKLPIQAGIDIATTCSVMLAAWMFIIQMKNESKKTRAERDRKALEDSLDHAKARIDTFRDKFYSQAVELSNCFETSSDPIKDFSRIWGEYVYAYRRWAEEEIIREFRYAFTFLSEKSNSRFNKKATELIDDFRRNIADSIEQSNKLYKGFMSKVDDKNITDEATKQCLAAVIHFMTLNEEGNVKYPLGRLDDLLFAMQKEIKNVVEN